MNNMLSAAVQQAFGLFLITRKIVADDKVKFYIHWVERFLAWRGPVSNLADDPAALSRFLDELSREKGPWQVNQARDAVRLFLFSGKQSPRLRTRRSLPSRMSQPIRQRGTN